MNAPMLMTMCPPLEDCAAAVLLEELVPVMTAPVDVEDAVETSAVNCEREGSVTPALEQSVLA